MKEKTLHPFFQVLKCFFKKTQKTIYSLFLEKIGWIQKHDSELKFEYGGMNQLLLKTIVKNSTFLKESLFSKRFLIQMWNTNTCLKMFGH